MIRKIIDKFLDDKQPDEYDPFKRPPDFKVARNHANASKFALAGDQKSIKSQVCPCCGFPIEVEQLSLCCDKQDLNFNGAGVPLYFEFLIFSIIILVILGLVSGIYTTVMNNLGDRCDVESTEICTLNYYNKYSLSNRTGELDVVLCVLDLLSTIFIIAATIYYRRFMNLTTAEIDNANIALSDFSIQVNNLPSDATEYEIKAFFSQIDSGTESRKNMDIRRISMGYNIQAYTTLLNQKLQREAELTSLLKEGEKNPLFSELKAHLLSEVTTMQKQIDEYEDSFQASFTFSGVAFITYNQAAQAKAVRRHFSLTKVQVMFQAILSLFSKKDTRKFRNNTIYVVRAPEPGDVLWENLGVDPWLQVKYQLITNTTSLLLLGACFGIILGISIGQESLIQSQSATEISAAVATAITILGVVASIAISFLNQVLGYTLRKLVAVERPSTQTEFNISYANKLGISQFLNTAIITLLVNIVVYNTDLITRMWKSGGLNSDVSLILITNAIFTWILNLFDPFYLLRIYKRYNAEQQGGNCPLIQKEANTLFEGPQPDMSKKYATFVKSLMLTFFYAQLLPIGIPLAIGSFIIAYWVEKLLFLRRYSKCPPIGEQLAQEMVDMYIELTLVLFAAGNCIWQTIIFGDIHIITWVQLGIAGAQLLIPIDMVLQDLLDVKEVDTRVTYDEAKHYIWDDYSRRNPVTMQRCIEEWMNERGNGNTIQDQEHKMQMLQKLRIQDQQKMINAQHKAIKKLIKPELLEVRHNQILPMVKVEESIIVNRPLDFLKPMNQQPPKSSILKAESLLYEEGKPVNEVQPHAQPVQQAQPQPFTQPRRADSYTYD